MNSHAKSPSFFDFFLFFATITRSNVIKVFVCSMSKIEISDGTHISLVDQWFEKSNAIFFMIQINAPFKEHYQQLSEE